MTDVHRVDYAGEGLSEADMAPTPWRQARHWVEEAQARSRDLGDVPEPLALSVATVDADGQPNIRTVLMRFFDERGPGFVTNTESIKGIEIAATGGMAASLTWPAMFRAIRFRGRAELLSREEVAGYFGRGRGRPGSAPGRRASPSRSQAGRSSSRPSRYAAQWPDRGRPDDVPVPDFWGGYRLVCDEVEFWGGRRNRLHDRLVFARVGEGSLDDVNAWRLFRRQP